jgi:hypothetical protein
MPDTTNFLKQRLGISPPVLSCHFALAGMTYCNYKFLFLQFNKIKHICPLSVHKQLGKHLVDENILFLVLACKFRTSLLTDHQSCVTKKKIKIK